MADHYYTLTPASRAAVDAGYARVRDLMQDLHLVLTTDPCPPPPSPPAAPPPPRHPPPVPPAPPPVSPLSPSSPSLPELPTPADPSGPPPPWSPGAEWISTQQPSSSSPTVSPQSSSPLLILLSIAGLGGIISVALALLTWKVTCRGCSRYDHVKGGEEEEVGLRGLRGHMHVTHTTCSCASSSL